MSLLGQENEKRESSKEEDNQKGRHAKNLKDGRNTFTGSVNKVSYEGIHDRESRPEGEGKRLSYKDTVMRTHEGSLHDSDS